jgi:hypothetical protein
MPILLYRSRHLSYFAVYRVDYCPSESPAMRSRLSLCSQYLKDVQAELSRLKSLMATLEEEAALAEALSFVDQALRAVTQTKEHIEALPETRTKIAPANLPSQKAG